MAGIRKVSWTFELNKKSFPVQTIRQDSHYRAEMDQGVCDFGATLSPEESIPFLEALNLGRDHLLDKFPLQIASTGLPYLLVPVDRDLDAARIINSLPKRPMSSSRHGSARTSGRSVRSLRTLRKTRLLPRGDIVRSWSTVES